MRTLDHPDIDDPLSEPTLNRRVWALYLRLGYTRASWARAMAVRYTVAHRWDVGEHVMAPVHLVRAAMLLRVSTDALLFGHGERPEQAGLGELIRLTLTRLRATPDARAALGEHMASPAAQYLEPDATYIVRWVESYTAERARGTSTETATRTATSEALNAQTLALAVPSPSTGTARPAVRKPRSRLATTRPTRS